MTSTETTELSIWEQDALALSQAALQLDQARADPTEMAAAMNNNLELWVGIKSLAAADGACLPQGIKDNLGQLFHYVAETTLRNGTAIRGDILDGLININLQLSEGLLEGRPTQSEGR